jgi:hypothetical protein
MGRICLDLALGIALGTFCAIWHGFAAHGGTSWVELIVCLVVSALAAGASLFVSAGSLGVLGAYLEATREDRRRLGYTLVAAAAVPQLVLLLAPGGPWRLDGGLLLLLADGFLAVLPAIFVLVLGGWVCAVVYRRVRGRHRARHLPDILAIAFIGLAILIVADHELLATLPALGLLFPIGAWASIRTGRAMGRSHHLAVRAAADIAMSLLIGTLLVIVLVWAANLFNLSPVEVKSLRAMLQRTGEIVDVPAWLWVVAYLLLAVISLAFAIWPTGLTTGARWMQRLRVVPSLETGRRVVTDLHIGLLAVVLIGFAGPVALAPTLQSQLRNRYVLALQREIDAQAELNAYQQIRQRFSSPSSTVPPKPFVQLISKLHAASGPAAGHDDASSVERAVARRLGQVQANVIQVEAATSHRPPTPDVPATQAERARAEFDAPIQNAADVDRRLGEVDDLQHDADASTKQLDSAAELAAIAVGNLLQVPHLGNHEVIDIVKEYLSGLVESGPLKDIIATWAQRLTHRATTPGIDSIVLPDPQRLEFAAFDMLEHAQLRSIAAGYSMRPLSVRVDAIIRESPVDATVDLVVTVRQVDAASCPGCAHPPSLFDERVRSPREDSVPHLEPGIR